MKSAEEASGEACRRAEEAAAKAEKAADFGLVVVEVNIACPPLFHDADRPSGLYGLNNFGQQHRLDIVALGVRAYRDPGILQSVAAMIQPVLVAGLTFFALSPCSLAPVLERFGHRAGSKMYGRSLGSLGIVKGLLRSAWRRMVEL